MSVRFWDGKICHDTEACLQGLNLLGHAQILELFIGSRCGGHGECGGDRIQLALEDRKKANAPTEIEKQFLSADELNDGWRIACQCFPNEDGLEINVDF